MSWGSKTYNERTVLWCKVVDITDNKSGETEDYKRGKRRDSV